MNTRIVFAALLAGALALAACGSGNGGDSAIRELAGPSTSSGQAAQTTPAPTAQPTPLPTETPDILPQTFIQPAQVVDVQQVEVTRIVEVTQPAQIIERTVEVVITATPDIAGFQNVPAIDESIQPCPIKFWKRGRCVANDATVEAYVSEAQP